MTMDRHEPFEELISASLSGDLTDLERARLDAHLDTCSACRATLAAFAEQRRIMSGLRHVAPPRDLPARVRTGIERGRFGTIPWWRRPAVMFAGVGGSLAAVAGVLLALVLLNGQQDDPNIGAISPTPTPITTASVAPEQTPAPTAAPTDVPSQEPVTTLPPIPSDPSPTASMVESAAPPTPSVEPSPTTTPTPASPEPDVFLALTGPPDNLAMTVQEPQPPGESPSPIAQVEGPRGPAIAAELSPDGQWLAFITELGQSGMNELRVTRIPAEEGDSPETPVEVGETVLLGESVAGAPFTERMEWSPDGRFLAYTLVDPEAEQFSSDVWLFEPEHGHGRPLTSVGNAYVASWVLEGDEAMSLWVSVADDEPASYLLSFSEGEVAAAEPIDPADQPVATAEGIFQPVLSPNGTLAIYWAGGMTRQAEGGGWVMSDGGAPMLAEHDVLDGTFEFGNERRLFSDVTLRRDAFSSAEVTWGADGDAYAVWNAQWTGELQGDEGTLYPDPSRVYFGHATDPRGLTQHHAIDEADLPEETSVVDVKVSPTGEHLVVTVRHPIPGDLSAPRAELLLIERNTGDEADVVTSLGFNDEGWFGPAAFVGRVETAAGE